MSQKIIKLTESDIKEIVKKVIKESYYDNNDYFNSSSTYGYEFNEKREDTFEVDNFETISNMLTFNSDDDFYYIQIIKRKKDNPTEAFKYCQYLKYYQITSVSELMGLKNEIVDFCQTNNARAYIMLNPRSATAVNNYTNVLQKKFQKRGRGYSKYRGHEFEVAAGQRKDWNSRPVSIIDVDTTDEKVFDEVRQLLKINGITPTTEYKTPNGGLHIVLPNKDARNIDFSKFDGGKKLGLFATVHFVIDLPAILYSNVTPVGYK